MIFDHYKSVYTWNSWFLQYICQVWLQKSHSYPWNWMPKLSLMNLFLLYIFFIIHSTRIIWLVIEFFLLKYFILIALTVRIIESDIVSFLHTWSECWVLWSLYVCGLVILSIRPQMFMHIILIQHYAFLKSIKPLSDLFISWNYFIMSCEIFE